MIPGVGTRIATGNSIPSVNAGPNYVIPARTPFALTAIGNDADAGDTLTYSWEQRDLGPQQDVSAGDNGSSPIFRSFTPTTDPTRTFPRLSNLLAGTTTVGETLPTTNRNLNFRVTVRDNRPGGGAVNSDDVLLTVVNTGTGFAVVSPNGGQTLNSSSQQTVTWNVAGTTGSGINTANVNIRLSTDGGNTFPFLLADAVPNDGSQVVTFPNVNSDLARIKVEGDGNIFFDVSNANFIIGALPPVVCISLEHFDSVAAPNLPTGWTVSTSGVGVAWSHRRFVQRYSTRTMHSLPDPSDVGDSTLTSPVVIGERQIEFRHDYDAETNYRRRSS